MADRMIHEDEATATAVMNLFHDEVLALANKHRVTAFILGSEVHYRPSDDSSGRVAGAVGAGAPTDVAFIATRLYGNARESLERAFSASIKDASAIVPRKRTAR